MLKDPRSLYEVARALSQAVKTPVTLKMRSGYADTSLFEENLLAAQESGVRYVTLHILFFSQIEQPSSVIAP